MILLSWLGSSRSGLCFLLLKLPTATLDKTVNACYTYYNTTRKLPDTYADNWQVYKQLAILLFFSYTFHFYNNGIT